MGDTLTKKEFKKLKKLGIDITLNLSCDVNDEGVPCRTCRLQLVDDMKRYIRLHGYKINRG